MHKLCHSVYCLVFIQHFCRLIHLYVRIWYVTLLCSYLAGEIIGGHLIQAYGIRHTGGEGRLYARLMLHYPVQGVYFFFRMLYELHIAGTYDAGEGVAIGAGVRVFNKLAPAVQLEAYRGVLF